MVTKVTSYVGDAFSPSCPTRVVLDRIGDKWTAPVVGALGDRSLRFTELRLAIGGVAPKVLTQTLRAMERDGLLTRTVYAEVPPRVEYQLTTTGRSLIEPLDTLRVWAEQHVAGIMHARAEYDNRESS